MSRFDVPKLRDKIKKTEDALYDGYVTKRRADQRTWDERFARWQSETAPRLRTVLVNALDKLDDAGYITADDVPNSWHHNSMFWTSRDNRPADPKAREDWQPPEWLTQLRSFLDAVTEDEISAHALEKACVLKNVRQLAS